MRLLASLFISKSRFITLPESLYGHRTNLFYRHTRRRGENVYGQIYSRFEAAGLKIVASKRLHLTREQSGGFNAAHKERPSLQRPGQLHDVCTCHGTGAGR